MRGLDLFAGIGGGSLAMQAAGIEVAAHAEIEPFPCRVLEHRFPGVPNLGDVEKITAADLEPLGQIDVVSFGSPCQDWSVAGKRLGLKGHRSSLFHEAIRIVRLCRPRFAVFENVPGLFSSAGGWDFAAVLDEMAQSGALDIAWSVLDAQWFGVPQRRRRIFLVADFGGERAGEILSISEGVYRDTAPSREAGQEATGGPGDGATLSGYDESTAYSLTSRNSQDRPEKGAATLVAAPIPEVAGGLTTRYGKGVNTTADDGAIIPEPIGFRTNQTGAQGPIHSEGSTDSLAQDHPPAVALPTGFHSTQDPIAREDGAPCLGTGNSEGYSHRAVAHSVDLQNGLLSKSDTTGTLDTTRPRRGGGQALMEGMAVRRLTPLECERLQGFPDSWTDIPGASDSARYRALGNAWCVPVGVWVMKGITGADR